MAKTVVMFSSGLGSFWAAYRLIEAGEDVDLLFTDTKIEDEDNYRFLDDAERLLGVPVIRIEDGRTPWQVFHDVRMMSMGGTKADPCSRILKRALARDYVDRHYDAADTRIALGMDWTETHRLEAPRHHWEPFEVIYPMTEPPIWGKPQMIEEARNLGLEVPRLYNAGFPHANCGGFCVKQGHAGFQRLLAWNRERYLECERKEEDFRQHVGKHVAILRDRRGGVTRPYTLRSFRERIESGDANLTFDEQFDFGGCGCFTDD